MTTSNLRSTARVTASPFALVPLAAALLAAAGAAQAQSTAIFTEARAGSAVYSYNTIQGKVAQDGNASGTVSPGAGEATAQAYSDEGNGAFHGVQSVKVSADYATAGLHASVLTDDYFSNGRARAEMRDALTFTVAGGTASTVTTIGLDLTLTGTISEMRNVSYLYDLKMFGQGGGVSAGWTTVLYDELNDPRNYAGWAVSGGTGSPSGFDSFEVLADTVTEKHLHGTFSFTGAFKDYDLIMGLSLSCGGGTDCDFGNSGHLNFVLPDNVTLSSGSGLFLTGVGGGNPGGGDPTVPAVPEPETYALMLAGLGLVSWCARRRLKTGAAPLSAAR